MSFIGKRIRELAKADSLLDNAYFIVDNGNEEANKVSVSNYARYAEDFIYYVPLQ